MKQSYTDLRKDLHCIEEIHCRQIMGNYKYLLVVLGIFAYFVYQSIISKKSAKRNLRKEIETSWGNSKPHHYTDTELLKIKSNYMQFLKKQDIKSSQNIATNQEKKDADIFSIDDITWNDLDMDEIFGVLNSTYSSAGEEYLYKMLRVPEFDDEVLLERNRVISYFEKNKEKAFEYQEVFHSLGKTKKISLSDALNRLNDLNKKSNLKHFVMDVLLIGTIVMLFARPVIGLFSLLAMLSVNIFSYYKDKNKIEDYFVAFRYLIDMMLCSKKLLKIENPELKEYHESIEESINKLGSIKRGIFLISINGTSGSLTEIIMEYIRMLFHVDLIKFNFMITNTKKNIDSINKLFDTFGIIESSIAIASFRNYLQYYTIPVLAHENEKKMIFTEIYHPLIEHPVPNDLEERKCVLLTGSNASGKSTFLKTIAMNAIFAQTIVTCTAKKYESVYCKVLSSMSLRDNLMGKESYFMVEIKSLKRIFDNSDCKIPVLCFVDEVLRGTNTVERIAASSYILKQLSQMNVLCFAATHDIELTSILQNYYSNYHFLEKVENDDVIFNYKLYSGKAVSRNAIKLLKVIGFDTEIVDQAEKIATEFNDNGVWNIL